jgi:multisubunit Na+/H+ antiporter MnhF subunit
MSKNANLVVFFLIAFVLNILLMIIFLAVIIVLARLVMGPNPDPVITQIVLFVAFLASIVLTFVIYGWIMKKAVVHFNLENRIPQLFKKRK